MPEQPDSNGYVNPKQLSLFGGPIVALLTTYLMLSAQFSADAAITGGIAILCVVWWITEPIPIPATSFIPLALLPMFGVITSKQVAQAYGHPLILLLMSGFILSTALTKNGAHRRIALQMVRAFGSNSSQRLVFGFMAASAVLSMWISNTATTLMLLPVAAAVLEKADDPRLPIPLLLGIAYAASIGGMGTPIGTPPNVVFMGVYNDIVGKDIGFLEWMSWGIPAVLLLLPLTALWLTRNLNHIGPVVLPQVGSWRVAEKRVLFIFGLTALAWVTRKEPFGGWSDWFNVPFTNDAIVGFLAVVTLFLVPNGEGKGEKLLDWESASSIPWGMLILFGAGMTIATAFTSSGLSGIIGGVLSNLDNLPLWLVIGSICLTVTFLTELTSNTATTTLLMPILAAGAIAAAVDPRLWMIPAALSASCAFMLPVATTANLIVFSTGRLSINTMAKEGVALNFIGVFIITGLSLWLLR